MTDNIRENASCTTPLPKIRFTWVDYAKCFSIILVVAYHTPCRVDGYVGEVLRLLRMPAFFMISGFLFNINKFPTFTYFLKHRSIQLLVPYAFFSLVFYLLWLLVGREIVGGGEVNIPWWDPIVDFIYGSPHAVVSTFWFICCLFSIQTIYYFLAMYVPHCLIMPITLLMPLLHALPWVQFLPWNLSLAFLYIPLYAFPNLHKDFIKSLTYKNICIILPTLFLALIGVCFITNERTLLQSLLTPVVSLLMLPAYVGFIKVVAKVKIDRVALFIGKNTIIILALQNYIIGTYKILIPNVTNGNIATNILLTLLTLLICYIPIKLINTYFPCVIGRGAYFQRKLHPQSSERA